MSGHTLATLRTARDAAVAGTLSADQVELLRAVHGDRYDVLAAERLATASGATRLLAVQSLIMRGALSAPLREDARPRVLIGELRERLAMAWVTEDAVLIVQAAERHAQAAGRDARRAARS